jgi:hypothetical protein
MKAHGRDVIPPAGPALLGGGLGLDLLLFGGEGGGIPVAPLNWMSPNSSPAGTRAECTSTAHARQKCHQCQQILKQIERLVGRNSFKQSLTI